MKLSEADLQLYRSLTSRRARQAEDCLDEDLLMLAAANDLTDAERAEVVTHLGRCSDCAREYRIARLFNQPPSEQRDRADAFRFSRSWAVAAAVSIAVMLPALLWLVADRQHRVRTIADLEQRVERQRQQFETVRSVPVAAQSTNALAEMIRPQIGVPIVDLDADNDRDRSTPVATIVVPPTSDLFTLILHLNHVPTTPLDVELADVNGAVAWRDQLAADRKATDLTLALNRRAVPAGSYSIQVRSGERRATFRFRVEYR